jgi:predicted nucleotidyltransferase
MLEHLSIPDELKRDISIAAEILLSDGCREVYLFGSLANGDYTPESDIDLATVGLPKERFISSYAKILSRIRRRVDLIPLDYDQDFGNRVKNSGVIARVA